MSRFISVAIVLIVIMSHKVQAQELTLSPGKLEIVQDEKITLLLEQYRNMCISNPETDGYRVQIFFDSGSNSKNKASNIRSEFETAYPGIKPYLSYNEPYYRVRVGNFRTLIEAVGFQKKIAADYPNSFAVKDKILQ